jgi:hypothetical protein
VKNKNKNKNLIKENNKLKKWGREKERKLHNNKQKVSNKNN